MIFLSEHTDGSLFELVIYHYDKSKFKLQQSFSIKHSNTLVWCHLKRFEGAHVPSTVKFE